VDALLAIPDTLADAEAAPRLCAGITTFDALRRSTAIGPHTDLLTEFPYVGPPQQNYASVDIALPPPSNSRAKTIP
jgi:hypothetical protein